MVRQEFDKTETNDSEENNGLQKILSSEDFLSSFEYETVLPEDPYQKQLFFYRQSFGDEQARRVACFDNKKASVSFQEFNDNYRPNESLINLVTSKKAVKLCDCHEKQTNK